MELEKKIKQLKTIKEMVKKLEIQASKENEILCQETEIVLPDGQVLNREQIIEISEAFHIKKDQYNKTKQEVSDMQYETLILQRTEDLIKGRHSNVEEFLKRREENAGVEGYHKIQCESHDIKENTAMIDEKKGQNLQEISEMVKEMAKTLNDSKEKLQPLVCIHTTSHSTDVMTHAC